MWKTNICVAGKTSLSVRSFTDHHGYILGYSPWTKERNTNGQAWLPVYKVKLKLRSLTPEIPYFSEHLEKHTPIGTESTALSSGDLSFFYCFIPSTKLTKVRVVWGTFGASEAGLLNKCIVNVCTYWANNKSPIGPSAATWIERLIFRRGKDFSPLPVCFPPLPVCTRQAP